jgi:hypothetical protein
MSERIKGATRDRTWSEWVILIETWEAISYQGKTNYQTMIPDFGHLVDWLEGDGFTEYFFIEAMGPQRLIFRFENPKAAMNFKLRWT